MSVLDKFLDAIRLNDDYEEEDADSDSFFDEEDDDIEEKPKKRFFRKLENEDEDEEEESAAYLFRLCSKEEAEFIAIDGEEEQYITSMMSDEEYDRVAEVFMQSDDFDLEMEEEV